MPTPPVPFPADFTPPTCDCPDPEPPKRKIDGLCWDCWLKTFCYSCGGLQVVEGRAVNHRWCFEVPPAGDHALTVGGRY